MTPLDTFRATHRLIGDGPRVISPTAKRSDLARLFGSMGYRRGAEIGVWEGAYSADICQAVPGVQLTCVDPWVPSPDYRDPKNKYDASAFKAVYRTAVDRLQPYGCRILRMSSVQAARHISDGSLDFVYIDGNHGAAFVRQDLEAWVPKVRSGGIVSGHDYAGKGKHLEVKPTVDHYTKANGIAPWFVLGGEKAASWFWVKA